ncbi:MAG: DUF4249 domain-containing protein [Bacteroidales bacterium]|nr:DUF4249 domain-containing protein [Bacteroidales bacterium]
MRRFYTYKIGAIGLVLFAFVSCEKIIDLDLNQTEDKMVVDAVLSNLPDQSVVRLSKSNALFSEDPYQEIEEANVTVKTADGMSISFPEVEPGIYKNENFRGLEGAEYHLEIDWKEISISANSKMPKAILIDSIELVVSERGFMGNDDIAYSLKVHFSDPANQANYYRFDVFKNDTLYDGFIVSNDLFYNGIATNQLVMGYEMQPLDTICVQISSIDKANYSYFLVLSQSDSPFIIAPGNPVSNLQGNAIGYFGAYAQNRKYIIIPASSSLNQ